MTITLDRAVLDSLDTFNLLPVYRDTVVPASKKFARGAIAANELRAAWLPYFQGEFLDYENALQRAWRAADGPERGVEVGSPCAGEEFAPILQQFPIAIAHNNLERLIDVLSVQLGDNTADKSNTPERVVDLAYIIDALEELMVKNAQA